MAVERSPASDWRRSSRSIAGPFALWMLVTGRIRSFVFAGTVVALGFASVRRACVRKSDATAIGWGCWEEHMEGPDGLVRTHEPCLRAWHSGAIEGSGQEPMPSGSRRVSRAPGRVVWSGDARSIARPRRRRDGGSRHVLPVVAPTIYHNGNNMISHAAGVRLLLWFRDARSAPSPWRWVGILSASRPRWRLTCRSV